MPFQHNTIKNTFRKTIACPANFYYKRSTSYRDHRSGAQGAWALKDKNLANFLTSSVTNNSPWRLLETMWKKQQQKRQEF